MFQSVLIANRGEIACRVARTARRLGLRTVAVYSDADAGALHVRLCDEAIRIGPASARDSYLSIEAVVGAARRARVDCLHPGYGFLAENAELAEECAAAGIVFVGPPPAAIRAMGLKDGAKVLMARAGVPVVPGYHGERQEPKFLKEKAYELGYPVLIKAIAGGGGRGLRKVERHADFETALEGAVREATASFGDARVLVEKYVPSPRHIEIQVFADRYGNVIHLGERDCSLQRRHQKVMEEAPAPGMTPEVRQRMGDAAVEAARAVGYIGAGTVEFIADAGMGLRADGFWFMEMNTRLQVEHPVTEAITGLDLVEWQFRIAAGEELPLMQGQVRFAGHAVEARLYAEDPPAGFLPSSGRLVALDLPQGEGVRVDTGFEAGDTIGSYYDALIAKIIAMGETREAALDRLAEALAQTVAAGPRTNLGFLAALCHAEGFRQGRFDTGFIEHNLPLLVAAPKGLDRAAAACGVARLLTREAGRIAAERPPRPFPSPWDVADAFDLAGARRVALPVVVDGEGVRAHIAWDRSGVGVEIDGTGPAADATAIDTDDGVLVLHKGRQTFVTPKAAAVDADHLDGDGTVRAPMHGRVLAVLVEPGTAVARGQRVAVIEAMKMEHALTAPVEGIVRDVGAAAGDQVAEGALILSIAPASAEAG